MFVPRTTHVGAIFFLAVLFLLLPWSNIQAQQHVPVLNSDGEVVFLLRFFNLGDGDFIDWPLASAKDFTPNEIKAITQGAQYWTEVLKPTGMMPVIVGANGRPILDANGNVQRQPVVINIGRIIKEAWATPLDSQPGAAPHDFWVHLSTLLLADGKYADVDWREGKNSHGVMAFGGGWGISPHAPSQAGLVSGDLTTVAIHELGHILGIFSSMDASESDVIKFPQVLTRWQEHLRDSNGNPARPGQVVGYDPAQSGIIFDTGDPNSLTQPARFTFVGKNALDVYFDGNAALIREKLAAGVGVPLQGLVPNSDPGDKWVYNNPNTMSHIDVRNGLMSWQQYRNYPMFLEVELATMQDIGYNINRRDFFGRSFYVDGDGTTVIVNRTGFGKWNGSTYEGSNRSTYGIGLHLFADKLNIIQAANIYADGAGAAGIRVDGVSNTVTINPGVEVTAHGWNGIGLLVAYGKDHVLVHRGVLAAHGPGGTAVRFDFGEPIAGARLGSYAWDIMYGAMETGNRKGGFPEAIAGPLVKSFDVAGLISGTAAAIYISDTAHVEKINILPGAVICGDIISEWARNSWNDKRADPREKYATTITFGKEGKGTMYLMGDIAWVPNVFFIPDMEIPENSLDVIQDGGKLIFNGKANVQSWQIKQGAILGGNSTITIDNPLGSFFNAGVISPGNSLGTITINSDYYQDAAGNLHMEFTPTATDRLIVNGDATIDPGASLSLQAYSAFYATGSQREITNAELFGNGAWNGALNMGNFNLLLLPTVSPTLISGWSMSGANPVFHVSRANNAYSQYATGATGVSLGKVLSALAAHPVTGDIQNLFAAMDFSHPDGSDVRSSLRQLAPTAYDNTAKASLYTGRALSGQIASISRLEFPSLERSEKSAFVLPIGGYLGQDRWKDNQGFDSSFAGVMGGMNRRLGKGLAGMHAATIQQRTSNRSEDTVRSNASGISLGAQGSLFPQEGFSLDGLVNTGLEYTEMVRRVKIGDYQRKNTASYTAFTLRSALGAGYEWQAGNFRFGPLAGLDYGLYHRPSVKEKDGEGARLKLDAANFQSLRSALGGQIRTQAVLSENYTLYAGFNAQWVHEIYKTRRGSTASFVGYGENRFSVTHRTDDRDALALNASLSLVSGEYLNLSAWVGTELFRPGSSSVQGGLSVGWRF